MRRTEMVLSGIEQPNFGKKPRAIKSLGFGAQKLADLRFDPIEAKVKLAAKYEKELAYFTMLQEGRVLNEEGKPKRYSAQAHIMCMAAYDKLINDLLRYGYARVSETVTVDTPTLPKVTFILDAEVINEEKDEEMDDE
jgi:hypothetical protein